MRISLPTELHHDHAGFEELASLHAETKECFFTEIDIDMRSTRWFDADMCAAFGAILYGMGENVNTINLIGIRDRVDTILSKNGFLSHYGHVNIPDQWETTIPYQRFDVKDERYFFGYVETELMHRYEMPEMSHILLKKFRETICEVFSNAVLHSHTELGIFSCGQFFPRHNRLHFTVADLGIGIPQNVRHYTGKKRSPEEAINWATKEFNTTKQGRTGGLGLKLLCEFIDLNGGSIQIASDAGYWQHKDQQIDTKPLTHPFPGTVVSVEINTADTHSYALASELSIEDVL